MVSQILRTGSLRDGRSVPIGQQQQIRADFELIRPENYHFSVPVNYHYNDSGAVLNLFDTIDGRHDSENRIEMIGFTNENFKTFIPELEIITLARAKIIAYGWMAKQKLSSVELIIFWYRRDSMIPFEYSQNIVFDEISDEVEELILIYLEWARPFQGWRAIRNRTIREIEFPFTPFRTGQREMMAQVFTAAKRFEQRLIEAPTGIGKTMASLFPSVKALESCEIQRIFYLTARNTGQEVIREAAKILGKRGLRLKSVTITSKEKSCARRDAIRECDDCKYSEGYYSRLREGVHAAFRDDELTFELIDRIGKEFLLCPFELSLDLALHADLIICDYNYVIDPNVTLKRFFTEVEENYLFLIDEAHNMVDRARSSYSSKLSVESFLELQKTVGKSIKDIGDYINDILEIFSRYRHIATKTNGSRVESTPPFDLLKQLRNLLKLIDEWLALKEKKRFNKILLDHYFEIRHFCSIAELFDETYCAIHEIYEGEFSINLFNVNPAPHLEKKLAAAVSTSLFSATVSPHGYFKKVLGLGESSQTLSLPSPFEPSHLKLLVADPVSTKLTQREVTLNEVVGATEAVVTARNGNYMAFFPSYEYMNRAVLKFRQKHPSILTLVQKPGMTEDERSEYLETFSKSRIDSDETLLGFAVMGGIFGEGVDLVGDKLNGVVVVGVGLPGISPEREQIRTYFRQEGSGFDFAYTYPGLNKVLQAAGRVIRSTTDRGVVLLIDERFGSPQYRSLFPDHWNPEIVKSREQIIEMIKCFYSINKEVVKLK